MYRLALLVSLVSLVSCRADDRDRERGRTDDDDAGWQAPEFPEYIGAGSRECSYCGLEPELGCAASLRYGCRGGGSCAVEIACDSSCCLLDTVERVGLETEPWGPIIAAAQQDPRPPTGAIAIAHGPDLSLVRPAITTARPWPILRLPCTPDAWAWSGRHGQLWLASAGSVSRIDASTHELTKVASGGVYGTWFDLAPDGERVASVQAPEGNDEPNTLALTSAEGARELWPLGLGQISFPVWSADGRSIALTLQRGPTSSVRIADVEHRGVIDVQRIGQLVRPTWHPGGAFLAVWRQDQERCVLELISADGQRSAETPIVVSGWGCPRIAFSSDGRHLAVARDRESHEYARLDVVPLAALDQATTITQWAGRGQLRWLDDADARALSSLAGWVSDSERGSAEPADPRAPVSPRPLGAIAEPGQIPREGLLAFVDRVDAQAQVHVVSPRGGKTRALTAIESGVEAPSWSPDGSGLAFLTRGPVGDPAGTERRLRVLDLAADVVYAPAILDAPTGPPIWSPDASALVAAMQDDPHRPPTLWSWRFLDGHWGSVAQDSSALLGSLDAAPAWSGYGLLSVGPVQGFERLVRASGPHDDKIEQPGAWLPRMIAPQWHPSGPWFAAWVGAGGYYELGWVFIEPEHPDGRWQATGLRFDAVAAAADVAEPSPIAFVPDGSAFAFARPDPERGGVSIEVALVGAPTHTTTVAHSDAGFTQVSWSPQATTPLLARARLPLRGATAAPKRLKQEPDFLGRALDPIVVACQRAHPVELGARVSLRTTSVGATGAITEAVVEGELSDSRFARCLETGVVHRGFDPFVEPSYTFTMHFTVQAGGVGSGL